MNISVNGVSYSSWDDVPPTVRQQLAATLPDKDRNGIPDIFEGNGFASMVQDALSGATAPPGQPAQPGQPLTATTILVNGQTATSMASLPPEVQRVMRQAFGWPAQPTGQPTGQTGAQPAVAQPTPAQPPGTTTPIPPGQVLLNGVPTPVDGTAPKKGFWSRLFSR